MPSTVRGLIWVCTDCLFARESDTEPSEPDRVPWSAIPDGCTVTLGMLWSEHSDTCPNREAEDYVTECDCERQDFSWHRCGGCGSTLGGERHAYTLWDETPDTERITT